MRLLNTFYIFKSSINLKINFTVVLLTVNIPIISWTHLRNTYIHKKKYSWLCKNILYLGIIYDLFNI